MNPWREGSRLWAIKNALLDLAHILSRPAPLARRAFAWTLARSGAFARFGANLLPGLLAALGFGLAIFALGALFLAANAAFNPSDSLLEVALQRPACQRASKLLASTQDLELLALSRSTFLWKDSGSEPACWRDRDGWRLMLKTPTPATQWLAEPSRVRAASRWLEEAGAPGASLTLARASNPAAIALEALGWREASRDSRVFARQRLQSPRPGLPPFAPLFIFFNGSIAALGGAIAFAIARALWRHGPRLARAAMAWGRALGPHSARRARRVLQVGSARALKALPSAIKHKTKRLSWPCAKAALLGAALFPLGSLSLAFIFLTSQAEDPRFWAPAAASDCDASRLRPFNPPTPAPPQFGCRREPGGWIAIGRAPSSSHRTMLLQAFPSIAASSWRVAPAPPTLALAWRAALEDAQYLPVSSASRFVADLSNTPQPRGLGSLLFFIFGAIAACVFFGACAILNMARMVLLDLWGIFIAWLDRLARSDAFNARAQRRALDGEAASAPPKPKPKRL